MFKQSSTLKIYAKQCTGAYSYLGLYLPQSFATLLVDDERDRVLRLLLGIAQRHQQRELVRAIQRYAGRELDVLGDGRGRSE